MFDNIFLQDDYNTDKALCQALFDEKQHNLIMHMRDKDRALQNLIYAAQIIGRPSSYIANMVDCGTLIKVNNNGDILQGNFCHARLCPVCAWKRSLRLYHEVDKVVNSIILAQPKTRFLFLTLTQKNVDANALNAEIGRLMYAFKKFRQFAAIKKAAKGIIKSMEITYNSTNNTYHPHIHAVIAVPASYFKRGSPLYLSAADISALWQKALDIDTKVNTDIKAIKAEGQAGAIAEVCKYAVKLSSVAESQNVTALANVMRSIHGRRLFSCSGVFRDFARILKVDLSNIAEDETPETIDETEAVFRLWSKGGYKIADASKSIAEQNEEAKSKRNIKTVYKKESVT